MAKAMGILIDPATGDLLAATERDALGLIASGLTIGDATWQNEAIILQASKGEFKEYPALGVGIDEMLNDHDATGWARDIALQLEADGMRVGTVDFDMENGKLTIDANYNS